MLSGFVVKSRMKKTPPPHIWRVIGNILNKQPRTADKGVIPCYTVCILNQHIHGKPLIEESVYLGDQGVDVTYNITHN
jgi:hypothetical protein